MKALAQNTLIQNRYLVVHLIGKGGMGEVYLAVDQRLGSAVALKRTYFAGDEMLGSAFEREARTLARMRHPVLPKVSDHFGEGDEQYLVMEHIAGDDLSKRLEAAQKPFPVSWVMFWADQLLDALSYLHSHEPPIIHRDIKPQNLKLTDENHIILLDFGLSKTSTGQTHLSNSGSTGSVVGYTPHYAPMEQIRGIGTSPRSDLYSLSATLYQLVTNTVPADALTRADAMLNGMPDPIEPPFRLNPEIPPGVSEVILKGMEVSQEKRFANAREMQKALRRTFTQMQAAMSAQTVAFNIGDVLPAEKPSTAPVEETRIMPLEEAEVSDPGQLSPSEATDVDFDATLAFDPVENAQPVGFGSDVFSQPGPMNGEAASDGAAPEDENEPRDLHDSFITVTAGTPRVAEAMPLVDSPISRPAAVAPASGEKRSSGRLFAIVGGAAAIVILALGAAGAGWYLYNNYYANASAVVEPSPSPEVTPEEEILPPANTETAVDANTSTETNSNTSPGTTDTATDPELPADETDAVTDTRTRTGTSPPLRQNQTAPRTATNRSSTPARPTPKPRSTRGRTDIEQ